MIILRVSSPASMTILLNIQFCPIYRLIISVQATLESSSQFFKRIFGIFKVGTRHDEELHMRASSLSPDLCLKTCDLCIETCELCIENHHLCLGCFRIFPKLWKDYLRISYISWNSTSLWDSGLKTTSKIIKITTLKGISFKFSLTPFLSFHTFSLTPFPLCHNLNFSNSISFIS